MAHLHLFAIGIDDLRDMFGAEPELAGKLRALAAESLANDRKENRPRTSLLGKIGPLFKHSIDPLEPPSGPSLVDVENLVAGRAIPPERLNACWQIVRIWLEGCAAGHVSAPVTPAELERIDFDLARAGLPSQFGISRLWGRALGVNLRPASGMVVGYAKNVHVTATREAMVHVQDFVDEHSRAQVNFFVDFLTAFDEWSQDKGPLDVVGLWWKDDVSTT